MREIEEYLDQLESILPKSAGAYSKSIVVRAAGERFFERIAEASVDLGFLVVKHFQYSPPEEDVGVFTVLSDAGVIPADLAKSLKEIKRMRNLLAHQYSIIDDKMVYASLVIELPRDIRTFVKHVAKALKKR